MDENKAINILIVEDNEDDLYFIKKALSHEDYQLMNIPSGIDAYNYLLNPEIVPDIILLDYQLPGMNGIEIIEKISKHKNSYSFIFLTIDNTIETVVKAMKAGALDFIVKSTDLKKELQQKIQKVYDIHRNKIEKNRITQELIKSKEEIQFKNKISNAFITSSEDKFFKSVLDVVLDIIDCNFGYVGYMDTTDGEKLICPSMTYDIWDKCQMPEKSIEFPREVWSGVWGESLKQQKSIYKNTNLKLPNGHVILKNALAVPIKLNNNQIGQICIADKHEGFDEADVAILEDICHYIAPLLNAQLNENKYKLDLINAKELAEKNEQQIKGMLDAIPDMVFRLDSTGVYLDYKADIKDLYYKEGDLVGLSIHELMPKDVTDLIQKNIDETLNSESLQTFTFELYFPDTGQKVYEARMSKSGEQEVTAVVRDITEQKETEETIKYQNSELHKLNADKDRFIQILAHDLKSPFTALVGFSDLLSKNLHEYTLDKTAMMVSSINETSKNTLNLLEDILLWARAQSGQLQFNPIEIQFNDIFDIVNDISKQIANNKKITIKNESKENITINGDLNMLSTILRNLVSNAIKFTHEKGEIKIYAEQNSNEIVITVADNGTGISPEIKEKLFDITEKITTEGTSKESGTGLGLVLCADLIEKHGGEIWVESEVGKGSKFSFTIPN
jgi:PAS domain S-box-containing protein